MKSQFLYLVDEAKEQCSPDQLHPHSYSYFRHKVNDDKKSQKNSNIQAQAKQKKHYKAPSWNYYYKVAE